MSQIEISVVIPCLNEADTLEACIHEALKGIAKAQVTGEVLVVDNGSHDGSADVAAAAGARVVLEQRKGYGHALQAGIEAARGRYILMGDADGSYDFGELPRFLQKLREGHDLVMGCRLPRGGGCILPGAMPWKHRWIGNPVLSFLGKLFFKAAADDFHCGLRAFNRNAIMDLGLRSSGMEFASEMVVKASLSGRSVTQIPVTLRPDRRNRPPHLRSWRDGWRHLRFMLLYTPTWLFLVPGMLLLLAGGAGFARLLWGPLAIGRVTFDVNTLLVMGIATLVGFQFVALGVLIKVYAVSTGLLPGSSVWLNLVRARTVEWGIGIGLIFILGGLAWFLLAVLKWQAVDFGPLSCSASLRMVIPAMMAVALGVQIMFYGFALAVLSVKS